MCSMSAIRELLVGPKATARRNLADWNAQKLRRVGEDDLLDFTGLSPIHHLFLEMGFDDCPLDRHKQLEAVALDILTHAKSKGFLERLVNCVDKDPQAQGWINTTFYWAVWAGAYHSVRYIYHNVANAQLPLDVLNSYDPPQRPIDACLLREQTGDDGPSVDKLFRDESQGGAHTHRDEFKSKYRKLGNLLKAMRRERDGPAAAPAPAAPAPELVVVLGGQPAAPRRRPPAARCRAPPPAAPRRHDPPTAGGSSSDDDDAPPAAAPAPPAPAPPAPPRAAPAEEVLPAPAPAAPAVPPTVVSPRPRRRPPARERRPPAPPAVSPPVLNEDSDDDGIGAEEQRVAALQQQLEDAKRALQEKQDRKKRKRESELKKEIAATSADIDDETKEIDRLSKETARRKKKKTKLSAKKRQLERELANL